MERSAALAALTLALLSCQTPRSPEAASGGVDISCTIDTPSLHPREGELAAVTLRIRNASGEPALLRDLTPAEGGGTAITWQVSRPGRLTYAGDRDEWTYDRRKSGPPRPVFNAGLLLPSEEAEVRLRLRLLGLPKEFRLSYFLLPRAEIMQKVYFEKEVEGETRYVRLVGRELDERLAARPEGAKRTMVIFPHAEQVVSTAQIAAIRVDAEIEPRPFGSPEAAAKAGFAAPDETTYSLFLDGWVLRAGDEVRLVTPAGAKPLPRIVSIERFFVFLDAQGPGKVEIEFARDSIAAAFQEQRYEILSQTGGDRTRRLAFLPLADLPRFFEDARSLKLKLDVDTPPEGAGRLVVLR